MTTKVLSGKEDSAKRKKLEKISYFFAGFVLLLSFYDSLMNKPAEKLIDYLVLLFFLLAGLANILAGIYIPRISSEEKKKRINRFLFSITGIILILDASDKFLNEKTALSIVTAFAAVIYFLLAIFPPEPGKRKFFFKRKG